MRGGRASRFVKFVEVSFRAAQVAGEGWGRDGLSRSRWRDSAQGLLRGDIFSQRAKSRPLSRPSPCVLQGCEPTRLVPSAPLALEAGAPSEAARSSVGLSMVGVSPATT